MCLSMLPPRGCVAVLPREEVADVDDPTEAVRRPRPVEEAMVLSGAGGAAAGACEKKRWKDMSTTP